VTFQQFVNSRYSTVLSALVVLAVAIIAQPSGALVQWYYCLAFWTVAGLDFYRSQIRENGAGEVNSQRYSYADRFVGYLFAAPLIFPARMLRLAAVKAARS